MSYQSEKSNEIYTKKFHNLSAVQGLSLVVYYKTVMNEGR